MQPMIVACCNRRPAIRRGRNEGERSGTKPTLVFLTLLMRHSFAGSAAIFWQCNGFHRTSHSGWALHDNFKPTFRCALAQQSGRGTKPPPDY